jgi:hypothetical protein
MLTEGLRHPPYAYLTQFFRVSVPLTNSGSNPAALPYKVKYTSEPQGEGFKTTAIKKNRDECIGRCLQEIADLEIFFPIKRQKRFPIQHEKKKQKNGEGYRLMGGQMVSPQKEPKTDSNLNKSIYRSI